MCREEIKASNGVITVDNLVDKVTPKARREIPEDLKALMVAKIKNVLLRVNKETTPY